MHEKTIYKSINLAKDKFIRICFSRLVIFYREHNQWKIKEEEK